MIWLLSITMEKAAARVRRAGWRLCMFGGVVVGGLLASVISPTQAPAIPNVRFVLEQGAATALRASHTTLSVGQTVSVAGREGHAFSTLAP